MRRADRERVHTLFAIPTAIAVFVYLEMQRRQGLTEKRTEDRRGWVDGELKRLSEGELGHKERAEGVRNIGRLIVAAATVVVGIGALISLIASHTI